MANAIDIAGASFVFSKENSSFPIDSVPESPPEKRLKPEKKMIREKNMQTKLNGFLLVVTLALLCCGPIQSTTTPLNTEQQAPTFTLPDQNGQDVSLESLVEGGPAVLVFNRGHR